MTGLSTALKKDVRGAIKDALATPKGFTHNRIKVKYHKAAFLLK